MTITQSTTAIAADHAAQTAARRYYIFVLIVWSALSVAGNALHALESRAGLLSPALSAVIATIPPISLIALTHLLILHLGSSNRKVAALLVLLLALMASSFALSFTSLRDLAIMAGFSPTLAPLMAIIIDGPVVAASLVLYHVAGERRAASHTHVQGHATTINAHDIIDDSAPHTADIPISDDSSDDDFGHTDRHESFTTDQAPQPSHLAMAELVMNETGAKTSPYIIARALMCLDAGYSPTQAAQVAGVHRTTVTRWAAARDTLSAPDTLNEQGRTPSEV